MSDCIFCKIAKGEIPSAKIWEDDEYLAVLDIKPNTKGMTLVIPKKHFDSNIFNIDDKNYCNLFIAAKKAAKILEKGLNVKRVAMVIEGMEINHAHIKLYPLHGLEKKFKQMIAREQIFFEKYQGYLTTLEGPKVDIEELNKLAEEMKKCLN